MHTPERRLNSSDNFPVQHPEIVQVNHSECQEFV